MRRVRQWLTGQLNTRYAGLPGSFFDRRARIVDAGGGPSDALRAKRLFRSCRFEGINIVDLPPRSAAREAYDVYHLVDLDATDLGFLPDGAYDMVISAHTIEHLKDGPALVRRLCQKVAPSGLLYLEWPSVASTTFPVRGLGLRFDDDATHRQTYELARIRGIVEACGLDVELAGRRRQWLRVLLAPLLVALHSLRFRRLVLYDLWDVTGFCYTLRAWRRPEPGISVGSTDSQPPPDTLGTIARGNRR